MSQNKHYICLNQHSTAWNPANPDAAIAGEKPDCIYWGKVLVAMEEHLRINNLTFYLTWNVNSLPTYGNDVVVILVGDEWCRIPSYYDKVKAVFKCYGTQRILGCNPILNPSYLNFLTLFQFLKSIAIGLPGQLKYNLHRLINPQLRTTSPIHDLPLGYYKQLDLSLKPISERIYDAYFCGSLTQNRYSKRSMKYWLREPKSISRQQMIENLEKIQQKHPDLQINLSMTDNFVASSNSDPNIYSQELMNSKICLVPRGASFETFRFFEGLRYGCVLITEVLPNRWFYQGSPAIQVNDWRTLDKVIVELIENEELLQQKHQESLNWWSKKCSEIAVGVYIASQVEQLNSQVKSKETRKPIGSTSASSNTLTK